MVGGSDVRSSQHWSTSWALTVPDTADVCCNASPRRLRGSRIGCLGWRVVPWCAGLLVCCAGVRVGCSCCCGVRALLCLLVLLAAAAASVVRCVAAAACAFLGSLKKCTARTFHGMRSLVSCRPDHLKGCVALASCLAPRFVRVCSSAQLVSEPRQVFSTMPVQQTSPAQQYSARHESRSHFLLQFYKRRAYVAMSKAAFAALELTTCEMCSLIEYTLGQVAGTGCTTTSVSRQRGGSGQDYDTKATGRWTAARRVSQQPFPRVIFVYMRRVWGRETFRTARPIVPGVGAPVDRSFAEVARATDESTQADYARDQQHSSGSVSAYASGECRAPCGYYSHAASTRVCSALAARKSDGSATTHPNIFSEHVDWEPRACEQ